MSKPTRQRTLPPAEPLPTGLRLGRYELQGVLGHGPFAITYRALDTESDEDVVIKEYIPTALALRRGATDVVPRDDASAEAFREGLRYFVNEAQLLPRFEHPSLVRVRASFEAHGTAYMVMPMIVGRDLMQTFLARTQSPREQTLRTMLDALLGALETLHRAKIEHRDISARGIMMQPDGRPVLMDLGSPRRVTIARGDAGALGPREGYAAIELYATGADRARGPWTDLYALGAVMFFLVSGKVPPAAPRRKPEERPALALGRPGGRYTPVFLGTIDWMLAVEPKDRPQSVAELRAVLGGKSLPTAFSPPPVRRLSDKLTRHRRALLIGAVATAAVSAAGGTGFWMWRSGRLRWPPRRS
ncbi:MAG: serine/threonine-protein kinase [Rubrivivax sp.]